MQPSQRRRLVVRTVWIAGLLLLAALGLTARLVDLQIVQAPTLNRAALAEQYAHLSLPPVRGKITDRDGRVMALETPGEALWAMPHAIREPAEMARSLAPILDEPAAKIRRQLTSHEAFVWLSYHVTLGQAARIEALGTFDGLGLQSVSWRIYPQGDLAGAVLGFVGTDQNGLAGVELSYQKQLAGSPGQEVVKVDAMGNPLPQYSVRKVSAVPGDGLETTLDLVIQSFAQQDLDAAVKAHKAKGGRILVLDPTTGAVLAMAQDPEPDPGKWSSEPQSEWVDEPVEYAFEPGSTIKPITAAAALSAGVATPSWSIMDHGSMVIDGVRIYDWIPSGFGRLTFDGIMAESSDIGFATLAIDLGASRLYHYLDLFHLDRPTGVDLPGETGGLVPKESQATPLDVGEMGFGQTIAISPIQLAAAVAAVADGGVWHTPHVGQALLLPDGQQQALHFPSQRVVTTTVAHEVQTAMLDVMTAGTGDPAQVAGYRIAGKTGTANVVGNSGRFQNGDYLSSFIGYGPVPDPKVLILIQVDDSKVLYYGADVAAPVFAQLFGQIMDYLGVPPGHATLKAPHVAVPSLVGLSYAQAALRLQSMGLLLSSGGTGDRVVSQDPSPGVPAKPGESVAVELGGPAAAQGIPDVLGMTEDDAYDALAARGYRLSATGAGIAARQAPAPGASLARGGTVRVTFTAPP